MTFPVGAVLCLYSSYFDPIECKLSMLRGGRRYDLFILHMLPLFWNLFTKTTLAQQDRILKPYLMYILHVHNEYLYHLKKRLGPDARKIAKRYPRTNVPDPSVGLLLSCNEVIKEIEGDKGKDRWQQLKQKMSVVDIPQPQKKILTDTTEAACQAWDQLLGFVDSVKGKSKIYFSPYQATYQFMAYASHLSKGYVLRLENRTKESTQSFDSALRHLRRVTLDMRKSILTTVFAHAPTIPVDLVRDVLEARRADTNLDYQDGRKLKLYAPEVASALASNLL